VGLRHIAPNLVDDALLGVREFERHEAVQHLVEAVGVDAHCDTALLARAQALQPNTKLQEEKLLEHQSLAGGFDYLIVVWEVDLLKCLREGHQPDALAHTAGQDFRREMRMLDGVPNDLTHALLTDALCKRVDGHDSVHA
jgi:hypothetical protein